MPHRTPQPHRRTFSWPPLLLRRTSPPPSHPLPDIHDDPFAHFITVADDDDPLALSAGILPPDPRARDRDRHAARVRASLARRWARYVAGHHAPLHEVYHRPRSSEGRAGHASVVSVRRPDGEGKAAVGEGGMIMPSIIFVAAPSSSSPSSPSSGGPSLGKTGEAVARAREAQIQSGRRGVRIHAQNRHSWQEPSVELFTVDEEEEEGVGVGEEEKGEDEEEGWGGRSEVTERARL